MGKERRKKMKSDNIKSKNDKLINILNDEIKSSDYFTKIVYESHNRVKEFFDKKLKEKEKEFKAVSEIEEILDK